jgi:hypothetical protein
MCVGMHTGLAILMLDSCDDIDDDVVIIYVLVVYLTMLTVAFTT